MTAAQQAADQISTYLMTGMHHGTPEGRAAMAAIIEAAANPPEICGLCGGPILPDDDIKIPHPEH